MSTVKNTYKKLLKYKNYSKKKLNSKKKRKLNSKKKKKSRVQWGCNNKYLGGQNLSKQDSQEKVNRELKTKRVGIQEKRRRIRHFGRDRRQQKTIKKILGKSKEKDRNCKLRRTAPRLKLGIRNWSLRRPQHIINKTCHTY